MNNADIIDQAAEKYAPGDREFKAVLQAIALAESGGNSNAIGDNGNSIGLFQNNMAGGRGASYTKEQLLDPFFNAEISARDLVRYYQQGKAQGLSGPNLVAYVSRHGQRPATGLEWNAARNYGRRVGVSPVVTNEPHMKGPEYYSPPKPTIPTPQVATTKQSEYLPTMLSNIFNLSPKPVYASETTSPVSFPSASYRPSATLSPNLSSSYSTMNFPVNQQYTVKAGDTLWAIAQALLGSGTRWKELQGYSGDPRALPIGTKITTPTVKQYTPVAKTGWSYSVPATTTMTTKQLPFVIDLGGTNTPSASLRYL